MTAVAPKPITSRPYPARRAAKGSVLIKMMHTTDPKDIAILYLVSTFIFFLVGGAMAFPFLAARGLKTGTSLLEASQVDAAARYLEQAAPGQIELPSDLVVATRIAADAPRQVVAADGIPADQMGLDIGPESAARFAAAIGTAGTVF